MRKNLFTGKFVAFEGLDGSGQTTQANLLKDFLIKKGVKVILTKEPTLKSRAGIKIKKILAEEITVSPKELQELFAKDRNWHQKNIIEPALKKGKIVISDRSQFSSLAYGVASGVELDYLLKINKKFIEPDLIILLKVSPKVCLQRIKKRGEKETLFEKEKQLNKVWQIFEKLSKKFKNIIMVNGEKSIEEIHRKIKEIVSQKLEA